MKKVIDDKMDVGMGIGRLLDRFLVDFGTILGGKLAPSWHQNPKKDDPKKKSKNEWLKIHATVRAGRRCRRRKWGSGPLKTIKQPFKTDKKIKIHASQLALWRIYRFI